MAKKQSQNGAKAGQARVKRAEAAIEELLKRENVVITASKMRILFPDANGKYTESDTISVKTLARFLNLPAGTLLMPQVQLEPKRELAPQPK